MTRIYTTDKVLQVMNSPVNFKTNIINDNIFHLNFKSKEDITSTLLRFQEYYESPEFKNRIFTVEEYVHWYSKDKEDFTYFSDWSGFNFPATALAPFLNNSFKDLSNREKQVLDIVKKKDDFYIIATFGSKNDKEQIETLRHEIAHAMYYLDPKYKQEINDVLKDIDLNPINKQLESMGYHPSVWLDECHAYLLTDLDYLKEHGVDVSPYLTYHHTISSIFESYIK